MGIEDIQISEELETNAPSIKYSGNEGPKSPQEEKMMMADAMLKEEYNKYVFDLLEIRPEATPMTIEEFRQMVIAESQMSGGQPLPSDPTKPVNPFQPKPTGPVLPDRQMAAYGGIMGLDGRQKYGLGDFVRKLIPNEVAKVAEVAAPFVALAAPQFALPAALAGGLGRYDRTGSLGDSLKSGLMTYGLGQISPGLPQLRGVGPSEGIFSPTGAMGGKYNLGNIMKRMGEARNTKRVADLKNIERAAMSDANVGFGNQDKNFLEKTISKIGEYVPTSFGDLKDSKKLLGAIGIGGTLAAASGMGTAEETVSEIMDRGEGLDLDSIRLEVREAFKDSSGQKLAALRSKYPYLGTQASKDVANMAMGGRIGKAEGGIMDLGGMEKDYRNTGGFVDIGEYEKKDDVPARLSVNEFVMTADAVRGMGDGDIDLGAKRMENLMGSMENKKGAQQMFDVSERLSEVI